MVWRPSSNSAGRALLLLALAGPAGAQVTSIDIFGADLKRLTGDWVAEDWDDGAIKMHPDRYNEFADGFYLTIYPPEPADGRSVTDVARAHFDGYEMDDDTLEPTIVNMDGAKELAPGIIARMYGWAYAFDVNSSLFGAVQRKDGMIIPYHANCVLDDPERDTYGEEKCLTAISRILTALSGQDGPPLVPPEPPAPISVPGWGASYDASGATVLSRSNFHGTVNARVVIAAPANIPPAELRPRIASFAEGLVDDFDDQIEDDPGTTEWLGSAADPWIRRIFPEAFSGPSIIMGGAQVAPDGKLALIGLRCPNQGWQGSCAHAVALARQQIRTGQAEGRRRGIVSATWVELPRGGLKTADVEAVWLESFSNNASGTFQVVYNGIVLLRDGRACDCFDRALGAIIPEQSQAEDAEVWGQWVRQGPNIMVTWSDGDTTELIADEATLMAGGDAQTRIAGSFKHTAVGGNLMLGNSFLSESWYEFRADGTFSSDRASSFSVTVGNQAAPDAVIGGGSSGAGPRGIYEIDGYNMKLTYPDGRIQWLGFAQNADQAATPAKSQILLDGTLYLNEAD